MAIETFTWDRQAGSQGKTTFLVREVQFGDGYSQATADGIKNSIQTWPLAFVGSLTIIQPILDFFNRHGGYKSFYWTPPGTATPCLFRVKEHTLMSDGGGVYTLAAEFKQVYMP